MKKQQQKQMKAPGNATGRQGATALARLGMDEQTFRQCMADVAPISALHEHLSQFAFNDEEQYAVELYCTRIAMLCGGMRTENGRHLLAAGFADGRGVILRTVEAWRDARGHAKEDQISVVEGGMPTI